MTWLKNIPAVPLGVISIALFLGMAAFALAQWTTVATPSQSTQPSGAKSVSINTQANTSLYKTGTTAVFRDPNITITYAATLTDVSTGAVIPDGSSLPIGTQVTITPKAYTYTDIYWFGAGYSADSPYGDWISGAPTVACAAKDYIGQFTASQIRTSVYVPLSIAPPTRSVSATNLSCGTPAGNGARTCTVNAAGPITATVTYGATSGSFYFRSWTYNERTGITSACGGDSLPLTSSPSGPAYVISVPQQTISWSLTGLPNNAAPSAPTISGPTSLNVNQSGSYGFVSTDPDGDTLRYLIDWNNDGIGDQYVPASGYVSSGTSQSASRSWSTTGAKTFRALASDDNGASSAWSTYSVTINALPECSDTSDNDGDTFADYPNDAGCTGTGDTTENPNPATATLSASPTSVVTGNASTLTWSSTGATTCTGTGFSTGNATAGSVSTGPLSVDSNYQITCTGPGGSGGDTAAVTVTNPTIDISASPDRASMNGSVNLTWTSSQCTDVVVTRNGTTISSGVANQTAPGLAVDNITTQTTFVASCDGGTATDSVIVNLVPNFEEF